MFNQNIKKTNQQAVSEELQEDTAKKRKNSVLKSSEENPKKNRNCQKISIRLLSSPSHQIVVKDLFLQDELKTNQLQRLKKQVILYKLLKNQTLEILTPG